MQISQVTSVEDIQPFQTPNLLLGHASLKLIKKIYPFILTFLALLPLFNVIGFLASTGANVLTADYIAYVRMVDSIAQGTYNWKNYLSDTFVNTHFIAVPLFAEIIIALLTHWNTYFSIFIGVGMAVIRALLLWDAGTYPGKGLSAWIFLPVVSALTFGCSQIDVFSFGQTSITWGFSFLGLSLGIWSMVRVKSSWKFSLLISAAGIISCWSGAMGFLTWPAFLAGMLLIGKRRRGEYAALFSSAALSSVPYIYYLLLQPRPGAATSIIYSNFKFQIFASVFGWPFSNETGSNVFPTLNNQAFVAGALGVTAGLIGITLYFLSWHTPVRTQAVPAVMLLVYGILSPFQILVFREFVGPWYNPQLMIYWIGLVSLAYVFWKNRATLPVSVGWVPGRAKERIKKYLPLSLYLWVLSFALIISVLYLTSNTTFEDKLFFLRLRSPAAASCLHEFRIAPNICRAVVYNPGYDRPIDFLAIPLERNNFSIFAPEQEWTLQGDFAIDGKVLVQQNPDYINQYWPASIIKQPLPWFPTANQPPTQGVFWTSDQGTDVLPWSHYKHLNLFLHSPNTVSWNLKLPANVIEANFESAVTFSDKTPQINGADGATFKIYIEQSGQPAQLAFSKFLAPAEHNWQPVTISLKDYAGKSISLRMTSDFGQNAYTDWALYRYPHINLKLGSNNLSDATEQYNFKQFIPQPSSKDLILNVKDSNLWTSSNAIPVSNPAEAVAKWQATNPATIYYNRVINACLSDYSHFYVRMGMGVEGIKERVVRIFYKLNGNVNWQPEPFIMPLNAGPDRHSYYNDLKLLSLDPKLCLTGISIQVLDVASQQPIKLSFELGDVRFIRKPDSKPTETELAAIWKPAGLLTLIPSFVLVNGKTPQPTQSNTLPFDNQIITGLGEGWLTPQPLYPKYWPVSSPAQLFLYSSVPQRVQFQMTPVGFVADSKIQNGQSKTGILQLTLNQLVLPNKPLIVDKLLAEDLDLQSGWNTVTLNYKDGYYRPSEFDPSSKNYSQWSFMISNINIATNMIAST